MVNEPAIAPRRRGASRTREIFRELARAWASTTRAFSDDDEIAGAGLPATAARAVDFDELRARGLGEADARPMRRSPTAAFPTPSRQMRVLQRALAATASTRCPTTCRHYESARSESGLGALSARDDLAAGAQLPQLELRQRAEPARDRGRAAARDPSGRRGRARHRHGGDRCASSTTAAPSLQGARTEQARPGVVVGLASGGGSSPATARTPTS